MKKLIIAKQTYTGGVNWGFWAKDEKGSVIQSGSINYHQFPTKESAKREILKWVPQYKYDIIFID